jgi:hypothetical protein
MYALIKRLHVSAMLKKYSTFVLLSVPLATAASAQECRDVGQQLESAHHQWQSAQSANSEAAREYSACVEHQARGHCNSGPSNEAEYSACVENQARVENQAHERCKGEYSKLQFAKDNLETAVSEYESWRQNDCVQQPGGFFGKTRPLGVWPPAR